MCSSHQALQGYFSNSIVFLMNISYYVHLPPQTSQAGAIHVELWCLYLGLHAFSPGAPSRYGSGFSGVRPGLSWSCADGRSVNLHPRFSASRPQISCSDPEACCWLYLQPILRHYLKPSARKSHFSPRMSQTFFLSTCSDGCRPLSHTAAGIRLSGSLCHAISALQ